MIKNATTGTHAAGTNQISVRRGARYKSHAKRPRGKGGGGQVVDGGKRREKAGQREVSRARRAVSQNAARWINRKQNRQASHRVVVERYRVRSEKRRQRKRGHDEDAGKIGPRRSVPPDRIVTSDAGEQRQDVDDRQDDPCRLVGLVVEVPAGDSPHDPVDAGHDRRQHGRLGRIEVPLVPHLVDCRPSRERRRSRQFDRCRARPETRRCTNGTDRSHSAAVSRGKRPPSPGRR